MAIRYLDHEFISFQEYIQEAEREKITSYAHPIDEWMIRTLNSNVLKPWLNKAIDSLVSNKFGTDLASMVPINQKSFPELFKILHHCAKTLRIPIPHAVIKQVANIAYSAGTDEYAFIYISPEISRLFSTQEAYFVVGRECGHIALDQIFYVTLARFLIDEDADTKSVNLLASKLLELAGDALKAWSRRSEVTADRAGLLCCGDINIAENALLKLLTGMSNVNEVNIEDYLKQAEALYEFHESRKLHSLLKSQLPVPKRIKALRLFADSELYYQLVHKPKPRGKTLLSQEELIRQINQLVQP
ncbi:MULTISPECIES: M48 family metallopeptidase [Nostoc]|uniref:M48 family metallopeptidase n=2 Tax=Nostoc TaxID=1177 RepID=A0ABR8IJ71_9NOSO|nr:MULTISPECIES: M48 family metallopeptidase [Nostoc]MBD2564735.1 M48 family metallopeptidase [Nostoc linckia FACHB-391]MBD2650861.1 M48 family metallopeptidase [Nostoc foliaceum FACHB-393]